MGSPQITSMSGIHQMGDQASQTTSLLGFQSCPVNPCRFLAMFQVPRVRALQPRGKSIAHEFLGEIRSMPFALLQKSYLGFSG